MDTFCNRLVEQNQPCSGRSLEKSPVHCMARYNEAVPCTEHHDSLWCVDHAHTC